MPIPVNSAYHWKNGYLWYKNGGRAIFSTRDSYKRLLIKYFELIEGEDFEVEEVWHEGHLPGTGDMDYYIKRKERQTT